MQKKKKFKYFFKMAAIAAILDFGPSPKSNGMILGPYLTPHQVSSKSVEEFFRNIVQKTNKQTNKHTNKQTNKQRGVKTVTSDLRWRRLIIIAADFGTSGGYTHVKSISVSRNLVMTNELSM